MPKPSRILVLGLNYPPETTGVAPYTGAVCEGLVTPDREVHAVTAHPHYPDWKISPGYGQWSRSEQIDSVTVTRVRHFVPRRPTAILRAVSEVTFGLRLCAFRWRAPSAIVAVSPALLSTAVARVRALISHRHTPFVVWVQDLYSLGLAETAQGGGLAARAMSLIEGWVLRSATRVVVIHERFADRVAADYGVDADRIVVVRNWTHLQAFPAADVASVRARYGWTDDDIVIVHSGNMGVKQGLHHVVAAARLSSRRQSRVRFVLVGGGSQRTQLQELADEAPAAVQFIPSLDERDFTDLLQSADALLVNELPGVAEMAVPSKLTSYFAAERPVIAATDEAGITASEIRLARAGVVVPAADPEALIAAAEGLAANHGLARQYGENARRYQERFLGETFAIDQFATLLSRLIDGDGAGQHDTHRTTID